MRTTASHGPARCEIALQFDANQATRCFLVPGHSGRHHARISKNNPYESLKWLGGDGREFVSDKQADWPWNRKVK